MKSFLVFACIFTSFSFAWADSANEMIHTAKAVKAIMEKGFKIPSVLAVEKVEQMSVPPKNCILIIYERKPNTECPNEYMQGPFLDKAFVACFNSATDEVDYVSVVESKCPPSPPR